jgi:hypothetical protein
MRSPALFVLVSILVLLAFAPGPAHAANGTACSAETESSVCISEFSVSESVVERGGDVSGLVRIHNADNETTEAVVVVATSQPEEPAQYRQIRSTELSANQSQEIPLAFSSEESPLGEHQINVLVLDGDGTTLYDATGYSEAVMITEDPMSTDDLTAFITTFQSLLWILVGFIVPSVLYFLRDEGGWRWRG